MEKIRSQASQAGVATRKTLPEKRMTADYNAVGNDGDLLSAPRQRLSASHWTTTDPLQEAVQRSPSEEQPRREAKLPRPIPLRSSRLQAQPATAHVTTEKHRAIRSRRSRWLLAFGVGMVITLTLWILGNLVLTWWHVKQDDLAYGCPRTFQTDMVVGHNDARVPSHFLAINLHSHIEVIECPGGNCSQAVVYAGPVLVGDQQDLVPVTLEFKDVNGDGRPDMLLHVQGQTIVFLSQVPHEENSGACTSLSLLPVEQGVDTLPIERTLPTLGRLTSRNYPSIRRCAAYTPSETQALHARTVTSPCKRGVHGAMVGAVKPFLAYTDECLEPTPTAYRDLFFVQERKAEIPRLRGLLFLPIASRARGL